MQLTKTAVLRRHAPMLQSHGRSLRKAIGVSLRLARTRSALELTCWTSGRGRARLRRGPEGQVRRTQGATGDRRSRSGIKVSLMGLSCRHRPRHPDRQLQRSTQRTQVVVTRAAVIRFPVIDAGGADADQVGNLRD
jgi:hypothetical protein